MSEFGKGFTYCIGLFLAHAEREYPVKSALNAMLWFNGAADHLFELSIPEKFKFYKDCKSWENKCLTWRLKNPTEKNKAWALEKARFFLLEWDRQCGIDIKKGDWE